MPWAIANASYKQQDKNNDRRHRDRRDPGPRARATIDSGWREVADTALAFVSRFVK